MIWAVPAVRTGVTETVVRGTASALGPRRSGLPKGYYKPRNIVQSRITFLLKPMPPKRSATPPPILYKYFPPQRIDVLADLELRFSRPSDFNDRFDSHYVAAADHNRRGVSRYRFKQGIGILCLTERADDHLMWVHYADGHAGFVIGFDTTNPFFRTEGRILRKVAYQSRPPMLSEVNVDACFCKSTVWRHEREWRCVRQFDKSEPRNVSFEPALVKEIIFGRRMEDWQITRLLDFATYYEMNVEFMRSMEAKDEWTFYNQRKTVSLCVSCKGRGYHMTDPMDE